MTYHDLYLKSDVLPLVDVFENIKKNCLNISNLYPVRFISDPELAWEAVLKKSEGKFKLLTDIDMLLMIGRGNRSEIGYTIHTYEEANQK